MSETTQEPPTESAPVADPAAVVTPETTEEVTQQAAEPAAEPEPEQPKPRRADRHVANLTARLAAKEQEVLEAERRAQAAEAMLQAGREGTGSDTPRQPATLPTDIEARADAIAAQREFNRRLSDIDAAGKKEAGTETWEGAKAILTGLGATKNQAFLEALAETSNPTKIFAALADDSDEVMALLRKSPAAMAAHLGRLDAKMETTTAPRASSAPKPPAPLRTPAVAPDTEELFFDPKTSIKEWAKLYDARMPKSLGGRR
jgi:hypothetical protein